MVIGNRVYSVFWETIGKNLQNGFGISKHLRKQWTPRRHFTQAASMEM